MTSLRYREVLVLAATADETSAKKGNRRLQFTQRALATYASNPDKTVPVMRGHRTDLASRLGHVARWEMTEDGRSLLALLRITQDVEIEVGDPVSLGINHTSRVADSGYSRITSITAVREVSLDLASGGAMPSARVLSVGDWIEVPDVAGEDDLAAARDRRSLSAWRAAGLEVGHSVGNYGGSVPLPHGTYSTRTPT